MSAKKDRIRARSRRSAVRSSNRAFLRMRHRCNRSFQIDDHLFAVRLDWVLGAEAQMPAGFRTGQAESVGIDPAGGDGPLAQ
jgi:hypothetical protein